MLSEIGSSFWVDPKKEYTQKCNLSPETFGMRGNDFAFLSTGRSSIGVALDYIKEQTTNKVALLPAYTCESVIEPFTKNGFSVEFFSVKKDLTPDYEEIKEKIQNLQPSVFLFHRYFGFDTTPKIDEIVALCRENKIFVIEDRTQCLYSDIPFSDADFFVGSIRKWCEVPDGGFVVFRNGTIENKPQEADTNHEKIKLLASYEKYEYLYNGKGEKKAFLEKFNEAEELLEQQDKLYSISDVSKAIQSSLDTDEIKKARKENYTTLYDGLMCIDGVDMLMGALPQNVTPLYMPIIVEDRQSVQLHLRENFIYAPVIWPKAEAITSLNEETQYLYDHMLCIPVDQRYTKEDMKKIIDCLKERK